MKVPPIFTTILLFLLDPPETDRVPGALRLRERRVWLLLV
jgi:hypothetical protein